jgi:hypothetical protein
VESPARLSRAFCCRALRFAVDKRARQLVRQRKS